MGGKETQTDAPLDHSSSPNQYILVSFPSVETQGLIPPNIAVSGYTVLLSKLGQNNSLS